VDINLPELGVLLPISLGVVLGMVQDMLLPGGALDRLPCSGFLFQGALVLKSFCAA